jgi:hypothetical protein
VSLHLEGYVLKIYLLLLFIAYPVFSQNTDIIINSTELEYPWWSHIIFYPQKNYIRDIPIEELNNNWIRCAELNKSYIPDQYLYRNSEDIGYFEYIDGDFNMSGDFNNNGFIDEIIVCTYEDINSNIGIFILILEYQNDIIYKKYLFIFSTHNFAVLAKNRETITIFFCFDCSRAIYIVWDEESNRYILKSPFE